MACSTRSQTDDVTMTATDPEDDLNDLELESRGCGVYDMEALLDFDNRLKGVIKAIHAHQKTVNYADKLSHEERAAAKDRVNAKRMTIHAAIIQQRSQLQALKQKKKLEQELAASDITLQTINSRLQSVVMGDQDTSAVEAMQQELQAREAALESAAASTEIVPDELVARIAQARLDIRLSMVKVQKHLSRINRQTGDDTMPTADQLGATVRKIHFGDEIEKSGGSGLGGSQERSRLQQSTGPSSSQNDKHQRGRGNNNHDIGQQDKKDRHDSGYNYNRKKRRHDSSSSGSSSHSGSSRSRRSSKRDRHSDVARLFMMAITKMVEEGDSQPVPSPGPVPKFNDTYRGFPRFVEDINAYRQDYWGNLSERTIVNKLLDECLSEETAEKVSHFRTMQEVLDRLSAIYSRPSMFIESLIAPYREHDRIGDSEYGRAEKYLSSLIKLFEELRTLNMWRYFDNVQNVETISENFSAKMTLDWLIYQDRNHHEDWSEAEVLSRFVDAQYPLVSKMADLLEPKLEKTHRSGGGGKWEKGEEEGKAGGQGGYSVEAESPDESEQKHVLSNAGQVEKINHTGKPASSLQSKVHEARNTGRPPASWGCPPDSVPEAAWPQQVLSSGPPSPAPEATAEWAPKRCSIPGCTASCPSPAKCEFWLGMSCKAR